MKRGYQLLNTPLPTIWNAGNGMKIFAAPVHVAYVAPLEFKLLAFEHAAVPVIAVASGEPTPSVLFWFLT